MTNTTNCFWPKLTALSHLGKSPSQVEAERKELIVGYRI